MKLHEIDAEKFNNLLLAEPDANIYQSSFNADYEVNRGNKALFVEGFDEIGSCEALGMFVLKKGPFLSNKYTAYAPHGYLVNFYDDERFEDFHVQLLPFLRNRGVNKLIIEPHVENDAEMVLEKLAELSYKKSGDRKTYEIDIDDFSPLKTPVNIISRVSLAEDISAAYDLLDRKEKEALNNRYSFYKDNTMVYIARLDSFKTQRALKESINDAQAFVSDHLEDYKYQDKIKEREEEMSLLKRKLASLLKFEKQYGENPLLAAQAICFYGSNAETLFYVNSDQDNNFELEAALLNEIAEQCIANGIHTLACTPQSAFAKEVHLVGEYTCEL